MHALVMVGALFLLPFLVRLPFGRRITFRVRLRTTRQWYPSARFVVGVAVVILVLAAIGT